MTRAALLLALPLLVLGCRSSDEASSSGSSAGAGTQAGAAAGEEASGEGDEADGVPKVEDLPTLTPEELEQRVSSGDASATVVAFWATWCTPCIEEMPALSQYYETHREAGLRVLGVSMDDRDKLASEIQGVLDEVRVAFPMATIEPGSEEAWFDAIGDGWQGMLPASAIYDGEGERVAFLTKPLEPSLLDEKLGPLLDE